MAPPRRGRSRSFAAPELRGTLGTLLRTTLAQAGAVRDALERGAREGRARFDDAMQDRRRNEAISDLGEVVLELIRKGELADLVDIPEVADALAAIDELEARGGTRERDRRDDEPGRDWIAPESRSRFDRGRAREDEGEDGTVSSRAWQPVRAGKPQARVWRPVAPPDEAAPVDEERRSSSPPRRGGGIDFAAGTDDDEDLSAYMHPDDVPEKK